MSLLGAEYAWRVLILLVFSPFVVLALHTITSWIFEKYRLGSSPQVVAIKCAIWGHVPMGILIWLLGLRSFNGKAMEWVLIILYCFIVYNLLSYAYLHVFNMSETARRIRILFEIIASERNFTIEDLVDKRKPSDLIGIRVERLMAMGQLSLQGDKYMLKGKFLYFVAKIVERWGDLLGFTPQKIKTSKNILNGKFHVESR